MAKVKVWNDNKYDHEETFKGDKIRIPAGGHIEMDFEDALQFKGQFTPMPPEDFAGDEARYFKMIRVEMPKIVDIGISSFINPLNGKRFNTAEELANDLKQYSHMVVKDAEAEASPEVQASLAAQLSEKDAEIAALKAQLEQAPEKRGPGRPKKVSNG